MSRGLSGIEAEILYRAARRREAERKEKARLKKRLAKGPGKDISEETVERDVVKGLKETGRAELARIRHGNERAKHDAGVSDLLGVYTVEVEELVRAGIKKVGIAMAIELKGSRGQPTGEQILFIHRWAQAGAIAGVARCLGDVDRILREYGLEGLEKGHDRF